MNGIKIGDYLITNDTSENADEFSRFIEEYGLSGADVFNLFSDWHGTQLFGSGFLRNTLAVEYGLDEED